MAFQAENPNDYWSCRNATKKTSDNSPRCAFSGGRLNGTVCWEKPTSAFSYGMNSLLISRQGNFYFSAACFGPPLCSSDTTLLIDIRLLILTAKSQDENPRTSLGESHLLVGKKRRDLLQYAYSRRAIRELSTFFGLFLLPESARQRPLCINIPYGIKVAFMLSASKPLLLCFINS